MRLFTQLRFGWRDVACGLADAIVARLPDGSYSESECVLLCGDHALVFVGPMRYLFSPESYARGMNLADGLGSLVVKNRGVGGRDIFF